MILYGSQHRRAQLALDGDQPVLFIRRSSGDVVRVDLDAATLANLHAGARMALTDLVTNWESRSPRARSTGHDQQPPSEVMAAYTEALLAPTLPRPAPSPDSAWTTERTS